jgi:mycofactocin precursor
MESEKDKELKTEEKRDEEETVDILEEIVVEDLTVDGICGVY